MNWLDIVLIILIAGAVLAALRYIFKKRKTGGCIGCSGCSGCSTGMNSSGSCSGSCPMNSKPKK